MSKESFDACANADKLTEHDGLVEVGVNVKIPSSAALVRLVEEVRFEDPMFGKAYDRSHNRHNR